MKKYHYPLLFCIPLVSAVCAAFIAYNTEPSHHALGKVFIGYLQGICIYTATIAGSGFFATTQIAPIAVLVSPWLRATCLALFLAANITNQILSFHISQSHARIEKMGETIAHTCKSCTSLIAKKSKK